MIWSAAQTGQHAHPGLGEGEIADDVARVVIYDADDAVSEVVDITITVTGANDEPTIVASAATTLSLGEAGTAAGRLGHRRHRHHADIDNDDTVTNLIVRGAGDASAAAGTSGNANRRPRLGQRRHRDCQRRQRHHQGTYGTFIGANGNRNANGELAASTNDLNEGKTNALDGGQQVTDSVHSGGV